MTYHTFFLPVRLLTNTGAGNISRLRYNIWTNFYKWTHEYNTSIQIFPNRQLRSHSWTTFQPSACSTCNIERNNPKNIIKLKYRTISGKSHGGLAFRTSNIHRWTNLKSDNLFRSLTTKTNISLPSPTAFTVKRPKKKKAVSGKEGYMRVVAYPLTDHEIDFESLEKVITRQGLYIISEKMDDMEDLLHLQAKYTLGDVQLTKEFFIFRDGSMVCWNVPDMERVDMLFFLTKHLEEPHSMDLIKEEMEWMEFSITEKSPYLVGDVLYVQDSEGEINQHKYAFSNALSQSVKLAVWELSLETLIESIGPVKKVLKTGMSIPFRRHEILQKHGEIFELRFQMNLNSELLDTPDFYWDRDQTLETLYKKLYNHLNIGRRTKVMNEKLNYCDQIIEVVDKKATDRSTERLEVMIIVLIMIEVVFESIYYYERKTSTDDKELDLEDKSR